MYCNSYYLTFAGLKWPPASAHSFPVAPISWTWKPWDPADSCEILPLIDTSDESLDWTNNNIPVVPDPFASIKLTTPTVLLAVNENQMIQEAENESILISYTGIYFLFDHFNSLPDTSNLFAIAFELLLINSKQLSKYWLQSILSSDI